MRINDLSEYIDLNGNWEFWLGDEQPGENQPRTIKVPGCWEAQGVAKTVDGPAHYRRNVLIPAGWAGRHIQVEFEAVSYACEIFWNGILVGTHRGVWTPFAVDISAAAHPGEANQLDAVVYKPGQRYPVRASLAGFLPDLATTFGGIWQVARLHAMEYVFEIAAITADFASRSIRVQCQAGPGGERLKNPAWTVTAWLGEEAVIRQRFAYTNGGKLDERIPLLLAQLWSPESPELYYIEVKLLEEDQPVAKFAQQAGLCKLSANGEQLLLNGEPYMLRGVLSWGWEPERIAPRYTLQEARAEIHRVREMGFNLIKLCLFIPNEAYFEAADEEGMLLWVELPMWLPEVNDDLREQAPREYAEMVERLRHHPSVVLYSLGCELNQSVDARFLGQLDRTVRERVQDVLLCDNSGSGESYGGFDFDFADFRDYHPYYDLHYFEPLLDHWRRDWQKPRPWIFGEFCDADTFRDQEEIAQANGGVRPWWLTSDNPVAAWRSEGAAAVEWQARMEQAQAGFSIQEIAAVSHRQAFAIRKYTLEALRRRRGMGGYVITGMRDTPISTSGVWDDLGRAKWPAAAFRQINGETVLCLDMGRRRTWRHGGDRPDRLDAHNFWSGDAALWYVILSSRTVFHAGARLDWTLHNKKHALASWSTRLEEDTLPGMPVQVGGIACALPPVQRAVELELRVILSEGGRRISNQWPLWVYPRPGGLPGGIGVVDPTGVLGGPGDWLQPALRFSTGALPRAAKVLVTSVLEAPLWQYIENGGRVLLLQQGDGPLPVRRCPFWREAVKLFAEHPLWEAFPHQDFTDMQFFGIASDLAFDTARLPDALPLGAEIRPILRRLDAREFHMSEYLFEARVGKGVLLACALNLNGGAGAQPEGKRNVAGNAMLAGLVGSLLKLFGYTSLMRF